MSSGRLIATGAAVGATVALVGGPVPEALGIVVLLLVVPAGSAWLLLHSAGADESRSEAEAEDRATR